MMYNPYTIKKIDYSKYKRFFAFGCSFTNYKWPTWADLMAKQMPNATYYNLGCSGAGHTFIMSMLNYATKYYNINSDTDLVAIMWSSFYREDRIYLKNNKLIWSCPGNIYTQGELPILEVHDPIGLSLLALSTVETTTKILSNSKFDSFSMWSTDPAAQLDWAWSTDYNIEKLKVISDNIVRFYDNLTGVVLPDMYVNCFNKIWPSQFPPERIEGYDKELNDYHPTTLAYYNYLNSVGIPLSGDTEKFAVESDALVHKNKTQYLLSNQFEFHEQQTSAERILGIFNEH